MIITLRDLQARRQLIKTLKHDPEVASVEEDKLWRDVLETIADPNCRIRAVLAYEALETRKIKFPRWRA